MNKESILNYLANAKNDYKEEGFIIKVSTADQKSTHHLIYNP